MRDVVTAALLSAVVSAVGWRTRGHRDLPPASASRNDPGRSVSVIVPARDEERSLPGLLRSLRSAAPDAEWIVVDDGSADSTAAVARAAGAVVVDPGEPPAGWTGKAWACHRGAVRASGEMLLFLDADTRLAPGALDRLLRDHGRAGGLVSVQPHHQPVRAYEQLSAYFNAVSALAAGLLDRHPGARPVAFGPCLLTSTREYETAGGHAVVRGEVLDDVALAAAYARAGLTTSCHTGGVAVWMRSYPGGVRQFVGGWRKNMASGAGAADPVSTGFAVAWVAVHHAVAARVLGSLVRGRPVSAAYGLAWAACALQFRHLLRRVGTFRRWTWVVFPVPLAAFDLVFALSAVDTLLLRTVRWRGRPVRLG